MYYATTNAALPVFAHEQVDPSATTTWETTPSSTRPDGYNPRRVRGKGCLRASTAAHDANADSFAVCRHVADGAWNVSKPLDEDAVITIESRVNGQSNVQTFYSNANTSGGPGDLIQLVVQNTGNGAVATAYTASAVNGVNGTGGMSAQWQALGSATFAAPLVYQGLAAEHGDVLFVGTRANLNYVSRNDLSPPEQIGTYGGTLPDSGYALVDYSWPGPLTAPMIDTVGNAVVGMNRAYVAPAGHFYSSDVAEATSWGFQIEARNYFWLETSQRAGTVPFNRCYHAGDNRHFYTTDPGCEGYGAFEFVVGYVAPAQTVGETVPLYRAYSAAQKDHLYTTDYNEAAFNTAGYRYEGLAGYVWPTARARVILNVPVGPISLTSLTP
jgi:hypothetical protein